MQNYLQKCKQNNIKQIEKKETNRKNEQLRKNEIINKNPKKAKLFGWI